MAAMTTGARGWWRRNALALGALAVLLPATIGGIGWWEWKYAYPDSSQPVWAVEPGKSGTTELQGATWGPVQAKEITDPEGLDMPKGAKLILVGVLVTPTSTKAPGCEDPVLVQKSTGHRWQSARTELGLSWNKDEPETCITSPEEGAQKVEPYKLILPYVVPADVEGPFSVDVRPRLAGARFVRFTVDP